MKNLLYVMLGICLLGCKNAANKTYRTSDKGNANFTVAVVMLYPNERLLVKVNNEVLLDTVGGIPGNLDSHIYFNYPKRIKTVSASGIYNGQKTFSRVFNDTLSYVQKLTLVIPFPKPKEVLKGNNIHDNRIPMESTQRSIQLIDATLYPQENLL
ncbi:hypothetical protein ACFE6N_11585 [Pedobacter sp. BG31]|uniref:hypothetical protein n=1 Tax=Pedobacter sp. BG31 TaxID=3349697 RepID=UPI0035F4B46D